jgi:hypothetical protein
MFVRSDKLKIRRWERQMAFVKGKSGNPAGRPAGARNKTTLMLEALFDGEAEAIGRMLATKAKKGDLTAARIILDRILPVRRNLPVSFKLPRLETPQDSVQAIAAIVSAVGDGELTPSDAISLSGLVDHFTNVLQTVQLETRLSALEKERKPYA